jgi:hypothetical protein
VDDDQRAATSFGGAKARARATRFDGLCRVKQGTGHRADGRRSTTDLIWTCSWGRVGLSRCRRLRLRLRIRSRGQKCDGSNQGAILTSLSGAGIASEVRSP